jgi:hypothetical protein
VSKQPHESTFQRPSALPPPPSQTIGRRSWQVGSKKIYKNPPQKLDL